MTELSIDTPAGLARAHLRPVDSPVAWLVLGHGAGGSVDAPDLTVATEAARGLGVSVALVEQPYRVAGKKSSPRPPRLDEAWTAVVGHLDVGGLPLLVGGRSAGARVACRTAGLVGAAGVLCLAFPLQPPPRKGSTEASPSRQDELDGVGVPVLVVQGDRDRFGMPESGPGRDVVVVAGDHGLKSDLDAVGAAVRAWLPGVVSSTPARA